MPRALDQEPGDQEHQRGRDAVVDHVEDRAGAAGRAEHEDAQHDEAEVRERREADQAQDVVLADGDQRAVDDRDQREHDHDRRRPLRGVGQQPEAEPQHAEGADLVEDADQQHRGAGGRLLGGVGQPGVDREHRRLDREGDEEADEQPALGDRVDVDRGQVAEQEARRAGVGGDDVEADHRGEHHQPAGELVDQELGRGAAAARAAEAADEEVRRDQRGLEDDVEEQHVGRGEDRQRHRLEREGPGEERLGAAVALGVGLAPAGQQHDRHEDDGEQHHQQAQPVDAERVVDAERLDPGVGLGELHAVADVVLGRRRRCRRPASRRRSRGRPSRASAPGTKAVTSAPTSGSRIRIVRVIRGSPPGERGRPAGRRRGGTGRRSGRSRSGAGAACWTGRRPRPSRPRRRRRRRPGRRWSGRRRARRRGVPRPRR